MLNGFAFCTPCSRFLYWIFISFAFFFCATTSLLLLSYQLQEILEMCAGRSLLSLFMSTLRDPCNSPTNICENRKTPFYCFPPRSSNSFASTITISQFIIYKKTKYLLSFLAFPLIF